MPRQYIIECGAERGRWLYKVEHIGKREAEQTTCFYKGQITDALIFKKAEAVAIAKKWKARVWQVKGGQPIRQVWPE